VIYSKFDDTNCKFIDNGKSRMKEEVFKALGDIPACLLPMPLKNTIEGLRQNDNKER
jgi:hypothetical protein